MAQQLINGKQQFIDGNGNPIAGGSVAFYTPGTSTPVNTWQDQALSILNANPVVLDASGMASIWGTDGAVYRQIVTTASGVTVWDQNVGGLNDGGSVVAGGTRLVVVTDSGAGATLPGEGWPGEMSNMLKQWGVGSYEVVTVAQPNGTFYRALNNTDMGGITALQATIDLAPQIVVIVLGFNDANGSDQRTLAQIESDALSFISQVAAALPSAKIYCGNQMAYDVTNGVIGSLTNEQVIPRIITVPTTGTDANTLSVDILPNAATQANTTFTTLASLQTYIAGLSQVTGTFSMDYYKIGRLGLMADGEHLTTMGARLLASEVMDGLQTIGGVFTNMRTNSQTWQYWSLQTLWADLFSNVSGHWVPNFTTTPQYFAVPFYNAIWHDLYAFIQTWFNQAHIAMEIQSKDAVQISPDDFMFVTVRNVLPGVPCWIRWWLVGGTKPPLGSAGTAMLNDANSGGTFSYLVRGSEIVTGVGNYNFEIVQLVGTYYDCSNRIQVQITAPTTAPMISRGWARATTASTTTLSSSLVVVPMTSLLGQSSVGGFSIYGGGIQVTYPGWYRVSGECLVSASPGTVAAVIAVNSATASTLQMGRQYAASSARYGLVGGGLIQLNANDVVYLAALSTGGGTIVDEGNNAWNNLSIEGPLVG